MDQQQLRKTKRRKVWANRMDETRRARFITDYVKAKHKDIYTEALQLYNDIRGKNPTKKDPRKTIEFLRITTAYTSYTDYYKRGRRSSDSSPNTLQIRNDNMLLNVELMPLSHLPKVGIPLSRGPEAESHGPEAESHGPEAESHSPEAESHGPEAESHCPEAESHSPEAESHGPEAESHGPEAESHSPEAESHGPEAEIPIMSQDMYETLVAELREDPELRRIFDHIPDEPYNPDNEDMFDNADMWDSYSIDEPTPLEVELSQFGF